MLYARTRVTAALLAAATVMVGCETSDPDAGYYDDQYTEDAQGEPTFTASPKRPPRNSGTCPTSSGCAPLTIHTSGDSDFYLVLKGAGSQRKAATIYLNGGDTFNGGMPTGNYDLYYTSGETWYGKKLFFGPDASVSAADSTLEFYETANGLSGVELTLYAVPGGNMTTSQGSLSDLQ